MAVLNISCDPGYEPYSVSGRDWTLKSSVVWTYCSDGGIMEGAFPKCIRVCKLKPHPSVTYKCLQPGGDHALRDCEDTEPTGSAVKPVCNPNYYTSAALTYMRCANGKWNYRATCNLDCGTITAPGSFDDGSLPQGELPWHAIIYRMKFKQNRNYTHLCSGTLISRHLVVSVAHPFWEHSHLLKADNFAVALGKVKKYWDSKESAADKVQKFEVTRIIVPGRFRAAATGFADNMAVLVLSREVELNRFVKPACLDFDTTLENWQMTPGRGGRVATFTSGLEGDATNLMSLNITKIPMEACLKKIVSPARKYFTSDKMCADAEFHEQSFCNGDVGAGLVFPDSDVTGQTRYYLRAVAALPPPITCRQLPYEPFTLISRHKGFLKRVIRDFPYYNDY